MAIEWRAEFTVDVPVRDLVESIQWYQEVLGFELTLRLDDAGWAEVRAPVEGVTIGLNGMEPHRAGGNGARVVLGVADIEAARTELEGKQVAFDGPTDELPGMVKMALFRDPSGNCLVLAQNLMGENK